MAYCTSKLLAILGLLSPAVGLIPINFTGFFTADAAFPLVIKNCSPQGTSVFYEVVEGALPVADTFLARYPNRFQDTITVSYLSLPTHIKDTEVRVKGTINSAFLVESSGNKYVLVCSVDDWKIKKYIPRGTAWSIGDVVLYAAFFLLGVLLWKKAATR